MKKFPTLKAGDSIELIAPASRCSDNELLALKELLESWQLNCIIREDLFAKDLLCANTDAVRLQHLIVALNNPETKAVICVRGGYGAMRLLPSLANVPEPKTSKIFMGMSDITCLHLYLQQQWNWSTIHGTAAPNRLSTESMAALKSMLFTEASVVRFNQVKALNQHAKLSCALEAPITGGNLTLIQASIGTYWQLDTRNKFVLIEEVGERGYRVDRMLEHLQQAQLFKDAKAILFADFLEGNEPDGTSLIQLVLQRFAEQCDIPVVQIEGVGHGFKNFPIPLGTSSHLYLGKELHLKCGI